MFLVKGRSCMRIGPLLLPGIQGHRPTQGAVRVHVCTACVTSDPVPCSRYLLDLYVDETGAHAPTMTLANMREIQSFMFV